MGNTWLIFSRPRSTVKTGHFADKMPQQRVSFSLRGNTWVIFEPTLSYSSKKFTTGYTGPIRRLDIRKYSVPGKFINYQPSVQGGWPGRRRIFNEDTVNFKRTVIILVHAFFGWVLCAATMGIGMATISMEATLIIHAIGAPIFFGMVALIYFNKFNYTSPLLTSLIFVGFVVLVDFFLVALLINRSLEMFTSLLGTWLPFILIFLSTFLSGLYVHGRRDNWICIKPWFFLYFCSSSNSFYTRFYLQQWFVVNGSAHFSAH